MQAEEQGDNKTPAGGAGAAPQNHEDQQRVQRVQQQAGQVVAPGRRPENLAIEHVRDPGQGMPIGRIGARESPSEALPGYPLLHPRIGGDVVGIIVADKPAINRGQKRPENQAEEENSCKERPALAPGL